jgi:hypothetical protein
MRLFIELTPFRSYLDKQPDGPTLLRELQGILLQQPEAGDIIPGSGGIRKMRLAGKGKGKSGGFRIWYLYLAEVERVYLMAIYSKNETEDLSAAQRQGLRGLIEALKKEARREKK